MNEIKIINFKYLGLMKDVYLYTWTWYWLDYDNRVTRNNSICRGPRAGVVKAKAVTTTVDK